MKVRVRRSYLGAEGNTKRGQEFDISESRFKQLTEGIHAHNPLVDPVEVGYKMEPRPQNKMELDAKNKGRTVNLDGSEVAKAAPADPTPSPPAGGRTGAASAASSSAPDPQPTKRKYTRRKGKPA